jgi:tRNA-splicing ligase RtcB
MDKLKKVEENVYELPQSGKMLVPGRIFASLVLAEKIEKDKTLEQIKNVAQLPGIINYSLAMPDAHQGYGACIGCVAAFDIATGVISPGAVGYDINCGVRVLATNLTKEAFMKKQAEVIEELYKAIPSGVGETSKFVLDAKELDAVLEQGAQWTLEKKYATREDLECIEDNGCINGASAKEVSQRAKARGRKQLGTLGSGNHFLEIQEVETIFDKKTAAVMGVKEGTIAIMIHCGSRGLGHQTASDYIMAMEKEYGFTHLPDRELACAPINSPLGEKYRAAMAAAANFAFANRQIITYQMRNVFEKHFPKINIKLVYDIAHNIAKFEQHNINGKKKEVCVHRKGATRSFGPGRKEIPVRYRKIGCPIFLPGSMGTYSYVLVGTEKAEQRSFGSAAHGAGRVLSRSYAVKNFSYERVERELKNAGVAFRTGNKKGLVEEAPESYKDINEVARVSDQLGLGKLVARFKPVAVVKG